MIVVAVVVLVVPDVVVRDASVHNSLRTSVGQIAADPDGRNCQPVVAVVFGSQFVVVVAVVAVVVDVPMARVVRAR